MFKVAFDYDGVITANYHHYHQLISDFNKSGFKVYVLSGANYKRHGIIHDDLCLNGFNVEFIGRPKKFISTQENIGLWKKIMLVKYDIDLWFDNEVKAYEQAGIDFSDLKTAIVRI